MGLLQHLTAWLGPFSCMWLIESVLAHLSVLFTQVSTKLPGRPRPRGSNQPISTQAATGSGGSSGSGLAPPGTRRLRQLHSHTRSGLCGRWRRMFRAGGQGRPAANPAPTLTHCMAVGKSVNLPDRHWEEPMFIIPSTEPIAVASGL